MDTEGNMQQGNGDQISTIDDQAMSQMMNNFNNFGQQHRFIQQESWVQLMQRAKEYAHTYVSTIYSEDAQEAHPEAIDQHALRTWFVCTICDGLYDGLVGARIHYGRQHKE